MPKDLDFMPTSPASELRKKFSQAGIGGAAVSTPIDKEPTVLVDWNGVDTSESEADLASQSMPASTVQNNDFSSEDESQEGSSPNSGKRRLFRSHNPATQRGADRIPSSPNLQRVKSSIGFGKKSSITRNDTVRQRKSSDSRLKLEAGRGIPENELKKSAERRRKISSSDLMVEKAAMMAETILDAEDGVKSKKPSAPVISFTPPPTHENLTVEDKRLIKQKNIVTEMYQNELNYVESLKRLKALLHEVNSLKRKDDCLFVLRKVLEKARGILHVHESVTKFSESLGKRLSEWDKDQVISAPIESSFVNSEMKACYTSFVLEHSRSQQILKMARVQNQFFDSFLTKFEDNSHDKLNVEALLMKPIQKLPQLILIIQRLLGSCDIKHKDRQGLQRAVMAVEQLANDLNDIKGVYDIMKQVEFIRDLFARTHRSGMVDLLLPKSQINACIRRDELKISMISPSPCGPFEGYALLFPKRLMLFGKSAELRGEKLMALLTAEIDKMQCIGHEIFFKAGMCDSIDADLAEEWKNVLEDEARLMSLKSEIDRLNREYRDLNCSQVVRAMKEHQAVSKDVLQSIKAAGCIDVFFSAEPEQGKETDPIDGRAASGMLVSQWKLTFASKEESASFRIVLSMLQMANKCSVYLPDTSPLEGSNKSLESTMTAAQSSPQKSPLASTKKMSQAEGTSVLTGCWLKTDSEKSSADKFLSVPLLHSVTKLASGISRSVQNLFDEESAQLVCAVPLINAPNICPLALDAKLDNFTDKPHPEVLLCYGIVWVIFSTSSAYIVSVYSICESGTIHSLCTKRMSGGQSEAFCAVAVPGLDVDDSFVQWVKSQLEKEGKAETRPKVLNQQSVWVGTSTGIVVYRVSHKTGIGSRVFTLPTDYPVGSIAYANGHVVAGLDNGLINVYTRSYAEASYGVWNRVARVVDLKANLERHMIREANDDSRVDSESSSDGEEVNLGSTPKGPVSCIILPFNDCLKSMADPDQVVDIAWCAIGNSIYIASIAAENVIYKIELQVLQFVEAMASIGVSVFVACKFSRTIETYHAETYQQLSIINLDKSIHAYYRFMGSSGDESDAGATRMSQGRLKDPRVRVRQEFKQSQGRRVSGRRESNYLVGVYPSALAIHAGNLWVGTATGHLIRFETSKIGLIPNIREPKICVYHFSDKPVRSIIFTGKKYHAAHQKVVMSQVGGGKGKPLGKSKLANESSPSGAKSKLNERKLSIMDSGSKEGPSLSLNQSTLYLAGEDEQEQQQEQQQPNNAAGASLEESALLFRDNRSSNVKEARSGTVVNISQSNSFASSFSDKLQYDIAFPMLTSKQDKTISSNVIMPTYVMVLGENLTAPKPATAPPTSPNLSLPAATDSGTSMLTFQVI